MYQLYGDTIKLHFFSIVKVETIDPDTAEIAITSPNFTKRISPPFSELVALGGDGLFTSDTVNPKWKLAHKLLMPAFSNQSMKVTTPFFYLCRIPER